MEEQSGFADELLNTHPLCFSTQSMVFQLQKVLDANAGLLLAYIETGHINNKY